MSSTNTGKGTLIPEMTRLLARPFGKPVTAIYDVPWYGLPRVPHSRLRIICYGQINSTEG